MENEARHGVGGQQHPSQHDMDSSYSDFLVTHLPLLFGATDLLGANNWLCTIKSKFGLLHYTEY
jgi:hypothetical protein